MLGTASSCPLLHHSIRPSANLPTCPPVHPPQLIHPPTPSSLTCPSARPSTPPTLRGRESVPGPAPARGTRPSFIPLRPQQVHLRLREPKGRKPTPTPTSGGRVAGTAGPRCSGLRHSVVDRHTLTRLTSARCVLITGQAPCWALGGVSRAGGGRSVDGGRAGRWARCAGCSSEMSFPVHTGSPGRDPSSASLPSRPGLSPREARTLRGGGGSPPSSQSRCILPGVRCGGRVQPALPRRHPSPCIAC